MVRGMSDKEVLRAQVMAQLVEHRLDQRAAAERLGLSVRQVKRLKRSYLAQGTAGLLSRRRGQPSNHRLRPAVIERATTLIGTHYADFGPTLAAEKLAERHDIALSEETVRQLMIAAGFWQPRRGARVRQHPLRERRARRGELIQIDGSPHDWFEGRAPRCCLLVFIDDATGELMELQFVPSETTLGYMAALQRYILRHGLPAALYSDRHSIFRVSAPVQGEAAQTQFARALTTLGIEGIQATSPQAKGRVERANQTLQDRLVKEMRLRGLCDMAQANAWLPEFIAQFNRRFAVPAATASDAHVAYGGALQDLQRTLSIQGQRKLSKELSCQYERQLLQVRPHGTGLSLRGARVTVHCHVDGRLEVLWQGRALAFEATLNVPRQSPTADGKQVNARVDRALQQRGRTIPPPTHPYKRHAPLMLEKKAGVHAQFSHPKGVMALDQSP